MQIVRRSGSDSDIRAAWDRRGFSGYSRGCVCTWYILHHDFEYFRYYAPMSCMTTAGRKINEEITHQQVADYLTAPMKARPDLPFCIYASDGYPNNVQAMIDQLRYVTRDPVFSYGQDPQKNNFFFAVSDFPHKRSLLPVLFL